MEMDIPDPEELEWMESNCLLPEEEEEELQDLYPEEAGVHLLAGGDKKASPPDLDRNSKRSRSRRQEEGNEQEQEQEEDEAAARSKRRALDLALDQDVSHHDEECLPLPDDPVILPEVVETTISRFASEIQGDCLPVTAPNGERVYAKLAGGLCRLATPRLPNPKALLLESFDSLTRRVEQEALEKALQESSESQHHQACSAIPVVTEQLWVEKYAPNSFTELLSDEHTNREVLLWLKQWDSCVFGSHVRATSDDVLSALHRHSSIVQKISSNKNFFAKNVRAPLTGQDHMPSNAPQRENDHPKGLNSSLNTKPSIGNSPEQKVLLLCGPPGLGKTTLAHVAARHCGYHVVEINASDDRSASSIESKILDVIQMNSIMSDSKPKCLVIDEIDGALGDGKGAVEVILKMVAAEKNRSLDRGDSVEEAPSRKASSRKGHKTAKLSRPVICICNDLYAPALRQLRQVAKVHLFVQPTISRVVNRLKYICKKEGFKTSAIALSALAEYTECDIRSCLNTLQFLNKKKEALNILGFDSQVICRKDMSKSVLDVWKQVLQKEKLKRGGKVVSHGNKSDIDSLYSLISNRGEYDVTMDGIHENFLRLSYHDPIMQKTVSILNKSCSFECCVWVSGVGHDPREKGQWIALGIRVFLKLDRICPNSMVKCLDMIGVSDSLLQYVYRTQQMSLLAYQPPIAITVSRLIAQVEKPNIEWPKALQRCRAMLLEKKDMLNTWQNRMSPSISRHLSVESFVIDVASPFLRILSPPNIRAVALHLLSEREKDELVELVDTMVSYSVTYKNTKTETQEKTNGFVISPDVPSLSLDPPIGEVIKFKVEKQKIMKDSAGKSVNQTGEGNMKNEASTTTSGQAVAPVNISTFESSKGSSKHSTAMLQSQKTDNISLKPASHSSSKDPTPAKKPSSCSSNFFDRFRKDGSNAKIQSDAVRKAATSERDLRPLIFKYNEGFTNAVKRPVRVRDLLL